MSELMVSLSGELIEHGHRLTQRVYYEDTDFSVSFIMRVICIFWSVDAPTTCVASAANKARF